MEVTSDKLYDPAAISLVNEPQVPVYEDGWAPNPAWTFRSK
jgi:hypothetical protein